MSERSALFEAGMKLRTEVLGEAHVTRSTPTRAGFSSPIQQFVTEIGWGQVWSRPALDRKARSMITVAMLAALGSEHELKVHVRGAVNNGVSVAELQEILLQSALYAGAPAALAAFRIAEQTLEEIKAEAAAAESRAAPDIGA
jgi:4-carboxymuconolactone decarboxylase